MHSVSHHGRTTAYRRFDRGADGPPIVFVHGSGGSSSVWKSQARLADEYPVVAVDLSGHGDSEDVDADPGYSTLSMYADDVIAVAREVDAGVLVGNSLGGAVLLHVALEREYDPRAIVLAGTGAKLSVLDDLLAWLDDDFDRAVEFLHGPDRLFHDADDELRDASSEMFRATGQDVVRRDFRTVNEFDVRGELHRVDAPALAVCGAEDQLTPPWYHEYLAENLPDSAYAAIEDAAHLAMLERPGAFNSVLRRFIDGLEANGTLE
ncbi:Pimeloyl-ACP methyl ester carboxylesterase [Natronoarchaeum philippinense]|uniref:Pimeloyl-ACP methyl ester carboxylesterase n=1 Tax=Natronoarchaeum philippinense TaxID=558529 RepID=A0A285N3T7_NATPI|nr:alpha/beta hydrolase [Natronoarchaeum philippinense]SNZ04122.1 Pimeloyl-ACP methyl ester carboxylesterase [Natronoarchaeum philippinense]